VIVGVVGHTEQQRVQQRIVLWCSREPKTCSLEDEYL